MRSTPNIPSYYFCPAYVGSSTSGVFRFSVGWRASCIWFIIVLMRILRPRPKPKKAYPNSDRFAEDGQRLYSAYAPAAARKAARRSILLPRLDLLAGLIAAAIVLAAIWWFV